ncbi:alpha/beta hydrolase, partial [Psychrobacter sp. SIMBA_152]
EDLMGKFLGLPFPRMFMYGEQNSNLSYLRHIEREGVELAEIPACGHFPMYSNPVAMWKAIGDFISRAESAF